MFALEAFEALAIFLRNVGARPRLPLDGAQEEHAHGNVVGFTQAEVEQAIDNAAFRVKKWMSIWGERRTKNGESLFERGNVIGQHGDCRRKERINSRLD